MILYVKNSKLCCGPRTYPTGFGKKLLEAYVDSSTRSKFRADLRRKFTVPCTSESEAFRSYPLNPDQWEDARLGQVFDYFWGYQGLTIPDSWKPAMNEFYAEYTKNRKWVSWITVHKLLFATELSTMHAITWLDIAQRWTANMLRLLSLHHALPIRTQQQFWAEQSLFCGGLVARGAKFANKSQIRILFTVRSGKRAETEVQKARKYPQKARK